MQSFIDTQWKTVLQRYRTAHQARVVLFVTFSFSGGTRDATARQNVEDVGVTAVNLWY